MPLVKFLCNNLKKLQRKNYLTLNTNNIDQAAKIIAGTAKSMGVEVID